MINIDNLIFHPNIRIYNNKINKDINISKSFHNNVKLLQSKKIKEDIGQLLNMIQIDGTSFINSPNLMKFLKYKSQIKSLLVYVKSNAFLVKRVYGKKNIHKVTEIIDKKLFNLGNLILKGISKNQYLEYYEKINGLLVDLFI